MTTRDIATDKYDPIEQQGYMDGIQLKLQELERRIIALEGKVE